MKISVVIATSNRSKLLAKCLGSLTDSAKSISAKYLKIEFVVVCNGPYEKTVTLVNEMLSGQSVKVFQLEKSVYPGAARNLALDHVTGDWIFFADDDIYVEKEFFDLFWTVADNKDQYSVIGGPNITPPESNSFQELSGFALASPFGSSYCSQRYSLNKVCPDVDDTALTLCNLFVKTEAMGNVRFSDSLICAEENSFLTLLKLKGHRFLASPDLKVYHERRESLAAFARQLTKYGHGRGQLIMHGDAQWFHFVPLVSLMLILIVPLFEITKISFFPLLAVYLVSLFSAASIVILKSKKSFRKIPFLSFLIATIHFHYAIGVGKGIVSEIFNKIRLRAKELCFVSK